jgi:hypothetical protein
MPTTANPAAMLKKLESFPWKEWDKSLNDALFPVYSELVLTEGKAVIKTLTDASIYGFIEQHEADPLLSKFMTGYVGERVVQLNGTTKEGVRDTIRNVFDSGAEIGTLNNQVRDQVRGKFAGYEQWRANRIARSETAIAFNHANVLGFHKMGVKQVEVADGTGDEICAAANGKVWTTQESLANPIAHPNCTRSFIPIVPPGGISAPTPPVRTEAEILSSLDSHFTKILKTEDELESLSNYTINSTSINEYLRGELVLDGDDLKEVLTDIKGLDAVFAKTPKLAEPVTVWRGVGGRGKVVRPEGMTAKLKRMKPGAEIGTSGYQSTTVGRDLATEFGTTLMKIEANHGIYLESLSEVGGELEFLLPHGTKYKVIGQEVVKISGEEITIVTVKQL